MNNRDKWLPNKYVFRRGRLVASRDKAQVGVGSRLIADIVAGLYQENLKQHAKGKLLDLGCGDVPLYHAYKGYVTDNVCVDWGNTFHKNEYLDFECDLTKDLPFEDAEFDTIILSDVLEHIPDPEKLWREMFRILTKNGKILISVPFFYWVHEQPYDYYRYTEYALKRFVDDSGLELIQLESIGGAPEVLADILAKNFQMIPRIGGIIAMAIQYVTRLLLKTWPVRNISKKTSHAFPLGYFLIATKSG